MSLVSFVYYDNESCVTPTTNHWFGIRKQIDTNDCLGRQTAGNIREGNHRLGQWLPKCTNYDEIKFVNGFIYYKFLCQEHNVVKIIEK